MKVKQNSLPGHGRYVVSLLCTGEKVVVPNGAMSILWWGQTFSCLWGLKREPKLASAFTMECLQYQRVANPSVRESELFCLAEVMIIHLLMQAWIRRKEKMWLEESKTEKLSEIKQPKGDLSMFKPSRRLILKVFWADSKSLPNTTIRDCGSESLVCAA